MKKYSLILTAVLITVFLAACSPKATTEQQAVDAIADVVVIAEGQLLPQQKAEMAFYPAGGQVANVFYNEGETAEKGDVLADLVITPQQSALVTTARLEMVNAENALAQFKSEAAVSKSQAALNVVLAEERLKDASDKKRDKEYTYRFSKTTESKIELDKATTDFELATNQLELAKLELAKWDNGPDAEQLAALEARFNNAKQQLEAAEAATSKQSQLIAPFAGQVAAVEMIPGQVVQGGVVVLKYASKDAWVVETSDIKETDILRIAIGASVIVRVDAIPGEEFTGEVVSIQPLGKDQQGDITYKVVVSVPADERFLWNMTASVEFAGK